MAINIKFDSAGNPEPLTIILTNRNGNRLGQLYVDEKSIDIKDCFNDASEFSFTLNKYVDGKLTSLWDKVLDFKLVYCKEWDMFFEIKIELDEDTKTIKTVFCTQLGQAELSQIILYDVEINTENDIARDDYKISILWDKDNPKTSILDRLLEKAPNYRIAHVDPTIAKIQRSFSFDNTSILDSHQEIAEEIGCLFLYPSNSGEGVKIQRDVFVYDLQQNCNDCGHRGEFIDKCPKCGSSNIKYGYGEDTLIFVTSDELASEGIQVTTDTDSVKNCFKLEAGDDLMTATIRNCNPNGSDYIWRFSDMTKEDMSQELVDKINSYDVKYKEYYNDYESVLDTNMVDKYNLLVNKYSLYNEDLQPIDINIRGYSNLMNSYYNIIDLALYLKSGLMPSVKMSNTTAIEQASLLTNTNLSTVAIGTENLNIVSLATANSAVLSMAKIIVKPTYKVEINSSSISNDKKTWTGNFIVTNYSDEEDTSISSTINVSINNDVETFIKQKLDKALNKEDTDDYSISGLFEKDYNSFCSELKKYALNPLKNFYEACEACLDVLIDQGVGNENEKPDLYKNLYQPYYKKLSAIAAEIKIREDEIAVIEGVWDDTDENNPILKTKGLQYYIEECRNTIQSVLNFEKYLGDELWAEFCNYRREDTYSNSNYISDGLNNAELFKKALEFIEVAENEIYKSSELQYSISTSLNNLLAIDKFKPLISSFELGNWIRVQVNNEIFKLRLIEYGIGFSSFENITVEFSNVTKIRNGFSDIDSILSQASSMATSYAYTQRQAKQGENVKDTIDQWLGDGLNSALVKIKSNNNEEVTFGKNGLMCRSYDDITEMYSPEQFKLTHNIMAYTTDNWETVSAALGKHNYNYYDSNKVLQQNIDYGLSAKFVTAGYINGSQIIGGEIYSQNYTSTTGTYMNLNNGEFSWAGGKIKYDGKDLKFNDVNIVWEDIEDANNKVTQITKDTVTTSYINALKVTAGSVDAENITGTTISGKTISGGTVSGAVISGGSINIGNSNFTVDSNGKMIAKSGEIGGNLNISGSLTNTRGNYTVTLRGVQPNESYGVFYITDKSSGSNVYPFIINGDGSFKATKANITGDSIFGGTLNAADGTFKGKLSAVSGSFTKLEAGSSSFTETIVKINANGQGIIVIGDPDCKYDDGTEWTDITIRPSSTEVGNIGTPSHLWDCVYARVGSISQSDRNMKRDIEYMGDIQEYIFNALKPVSFKFIKGDSGRTHYGFISQDVEDALINLGLTGMDFAGFCKDSYLNENNELITRYSLRYTEFIALNTHMIQKLQLENKELKERIDSLENMIKQLS